MRWGVYLRISLDREGKRAGVERQRRECERLIAAADPKAQITVYEDNDISAYSGVERPSYGRLLADVAAGQIDKVATFHQDRLWRSVIEQQAFLMVAREGGLKEVVSPGHSFDPADADDEFISTVLTAIARKESASNSRRMKAKQREKAERGEHHGGPRAFGHTVDRTALVKEEADLIREAARLVIRGDSMRSIVVDWNRRGVQSARGVQWRVDSMRDLLMQPRLAGLREHHGQLSEAKWPAIISREEHERLTGLFESRKRGPNGSTRSARKNLLAGMMTCTRCHSSMVGTGHRYLCHAPGSGGCGGLTVRTTHAEGAVRDAVLRYLDSDDFAAALDRAQAAEADRDSTIATSLDLLARDRAKLTELGDGFADGTLDLDEYRRLTTRLRDRITETEQTIASLSAVKIEAVEWRGQGEKLRAAWDAMTLEERRDVLRALMHGIDVLPARPPMNRFDPERLQIRWRYT